MQTSRTPLLLSMDGTDIRTGGRTDTRPLHKPCTPHYGPNSVTPICIELLFVELLFDPIAHTECSDAAHCLGLQQIRGGLVAEWLACWIRAQRKKWVQIAAATLSDNSLRQTAHTHRACVHHAAKLVAALLRVATCEGNCGPGGK